MAVAGPSKTDSLYLRSTRDGVIGWVVGDMDKDHYFPPFQ